MYHPDYDREDWSHEDIQKLPIYKKAWEIMELVSAISDTVEEESDKENPADKILQETVNFMVGDSFQLGAKIAGAMGGGLYDIKMENAAIIRKAAREIYVSAGSLDLWGYEYPEYCDKLRSVIWDEFRPLFAEWVASFNQGDYIIDRWGLFNPPGVNWDDKDPDEDLPWTNPFLDDEE